MEKALRSQTVPRAICHSPQQSRGETKLMGGSRVRRSEQVDSGGLSAQGAALSSGAPGGQAGRCAPNRRPGPATVPLEGKFTLGSGLESQG